MSAIVHIGDVLTILPAIESESVNCVVTSPPYWGLRDYGVDGQLGLEPTPDEYVARMVAVFREVRRVLRDDGTLWLNLGDSYNAYNGNRGESPSISGSNGGKHPEHERGLQAPSLKQKDLVGIPWRVAFALQAEGWYLRSDIIWSKPNPMPESVTDRPTKAHEYVFLMSKNARYWYDAEAIQEPHRKTGTIGHLTGGRAERAGTREGLRGTAVGVNNRDFNDFGHQKGHHGEDCKGNGRNRRTVWTIATQPYPDAHFATYPEKLVEPCILAGCPVGGTVLDPFTGSGTTGAVACRLGRNFVGIELNPEYAEMAERRIAPHRDQMQLEVCP